MWKKALLALTVLSVGLSCGVLAKTPTNYGAYYVQTLPKQPLSPDEVRDLLHMREEEKLARDVYLTLSHIYPLPVFRNISKSEEQHMRMVGLLLKKYKLPDPVEETGDKIGVFKNEKLQKLYEQLVNRGKCSLVDALKVGATIEDLDIKDLEEAIERTDNRDIKVVYQNLMKGSRNHMRAFVRLLRRFGSDYTPQFISPSEFNRILSVRHEAGFYSSSGAPFRNTLKELEGTVLSVKKVSGFRRNYITWWALDVQTDQGVVEVRVAPTLWYPTLKIHPGDKVEVSGFVPSYWAIKGVNGIMACKVEDKTNGVVYDFSKFRKLCPKEDE